MKTSCFIQTLGALALLGLSSQSFAQTTTAASDPVGFVSVNVPANSDAILAVPLYRASVFKGVIQSISGSTITVAGTSPAWTTNQFVQALPAQSNTYAVLLASGAKEGMIARISSNSANGVTVTLDAGDDLAGVATEAANGTGNGDHIDIVPYWTPSSLLSGLPTSGVEAYFRSASQVGTNLSPFTIYELVGANWLNQDTGDNENHSPLAFGQAFVIRNGSAAPVAVTVAGSVPMTTHRKQLRTLAANTPQDLFVGYSSPVPEAIGSAGLGTSAGDELHVYNNSASGFNKSPVQILEFTGTVWLDQDTGSDVSTTFSLQPGQGYVLRRAGTPAPNLAIWSDVPSYLAP